MTLTVRSVEAHSCRRFEPQHAPPVREAEELAALRREMFEARHRELRLKTPQGLWQLSASEARRLLDERPELRASAQTIAKRAAACGGRPCCDGYTACRAVKPCGGKNDLAVKLSLRNIACPRGHWGQE